MFYFAPNLRSLFVFVGFSIEIFDLFGIGSINLIFQKSNLSDSNNWEVLNCPHPLNLYL